MQHVAHAIAERGAQQFFPRKSQTAQSVACEYHWASLPDSHAGPPPEPCTWLEAAETGYKLGPQGWIQASTHGRHRINSMALESA